MHALFEERFHRTAYKWQQYKVDINSYQELNLRNIDEPYQVLYIGFLFEFTNSLKMIEICFSFDLFSFCV